MAYPDPSNVKYHTGLDNLTEFHFASGIGAHTFCKTCGSSIGGEFHIGDMHMVAINVRLFEDIDVSVLKLKYGDRKDVGPPYEYPHFPSDSDPAREHSLIPYHGNCQCKIVTYTAYIPSLSETEVIQDNCSICVKNAYILATSRPKDVVFHSGVDSLTTYAFGRKKVIHKFCQTCGSSVYLDRAGLGRDEFGMNARMFKDVNLKALKYQYTDGKNLVWPSDT
ncbi:hypothetical protein HWV62_33781 [Athelia sp. TMB]|nr:hypothetical protein HWV62_33781 [Athelia sp. TMB]